MRAQATDLIEAEGQVRGVRASTPEGPLEIQADLVVAADGRRSGGRGGGGRRGGGVGRPRGGRGPRPPRPRKPPANAGRIGPSPPTAGARSSAGGQASR